MKTKSIGQTNIRQKLSSESGASILVALLLFLMCAMVGSVILAAATASMGREKLLDENDSENDSLKRYALSSAANILIAELGGNADPVQIDYPSAEDTDQEQSLQALREQMAGDILDANLNAEDSALRSWYERGDSEVLDVLAWMEKNPKESSMPKPEFDISLQGTGSDSASKGLAKDDYKVHAEASMDADFNLKFTLSLDSGEQLFVHFKTKSLILEKRLQTASNIDLKIWWDEGKIFRKDPTS